MGNGLIDVLGVTGRKLVSPRRPVWLANGIGELGGGLARGFSVDHRDEREPNVDYHGRLMEGILIALLLPNNYEVVLAERSIQIAKQMAFSNS